MAYTPLPVQEAAASSESSFRNSADSSQIPHDSAVDLKYLDQPLKESLDLDEKEPLHPVEEFDFEDEDPARERDVEAQTEKRYGVDISSTPVEYTLSTKTKLFYLTVYLLLNLILTLYNKSVMGGFAFPWLLTSVHTSMTSLGCYILMRRGVFTMTRLEWKENGILVAFSLLFTLNIAISNVSLHAVSVPFHQIMRSTTPVLLVSIYFLYFKRSYSTATCLTMIPLIGGVGLATYGDYYYTLSGFLLTFLGVVLAAIKTIVSNQVMTGPLKLPAYEVLLRMSPLAAVQSMIFSIATGEAGRFAGFAREGGLTPLLLLALLGNGFLAFVLNVSSFQTNKLAGALTITVAGNVKQCLAILLGILLFHVQVGLLNGIGMFITVLGAAAYSKVELDAKSAKM